MKLEWSPHALEDRIQAFEFIAEDSVTAAIQVDDVLEASVDHLPEFPESGRPGRLKDTRELIVTGLPYVIVYAIDGDVVKILRVFHTARKWPNAPPQ